MALLKAPIGTRAPGGWPLLPRESCNRVVTRTGCKRARLQGHFCACESSESGSTGSAGDPEVQENLVKLLNEQVGANQGQAQSPAAEASSSADASGNPQVQDTLSKLVRLQLGAEQVKARAAEGSETLKQTAEEVYWPSFLSTPEAHHPCFQQPVLALNVDGKAPHSLCGQSCGQRLQRLHGLCRPKRNWKSYARWPRIDPI